MRQEKHMPSSFNRSKLSLIRFSTQSIASIHTFAGRRDYLLAVMSSRTRCPPTRTRPLEILRSQYASRPLQTDQPRSRISSLSGEDARGHRRVQRFTWLELLRDPRLQDLRGTGEALLSGTHAARSDRDVGE